MKIFILILISFFIIGCSSKDIKPEKIEIIKVEEKRINFATEKVDKIGELKPYNLRSMNRETIDIFIKEREEFICFDTIKDYENASVNLERIKAQLIKLRLQEDYLLKLLED